MMSTGMRVGFRDGPGRVRWLLLLTAGLLAVASPVVPASAQAVVTRKATTVEALLAYPTFFHTQPVRVRGEVRQRDGSYYLVSEAHEVELAGQAAGAGPAPGQRVQVTGTFIDPGHLEAGDPRLRGVDVATLAQARLRKPWPGVGELRLLLVDDVTEPLVVGAVTVRSLALDPERFVDQQVMVVGRFRGRNLFGDQPTSPGRSRWDFVLGLADASIWITGIRPRGDDFVLDIEARADTGRWLEVTGTVRMSRGLVYLDATTIRLARPPADPAAAEPVVRVPAVGPPPEVVFSTPTNEETDVAPTTVVRIQFSRDLDKATLAGRIRVSYLSQQSAERGEPQPPPIEFKTSYNEPARALEIRFVQPLERFRSVVIEIGEGVLATDSAPLEPVSLRFTVGG
jgi:hypothetical protein